MVEIYHSKQLTDTFLGELRKNLAEVFVDCKTIAIKIHFGEPGNKTSLSPEQIKPITDTLQSLNIDYFFYDSSVAYDSPRNNPESHKKIAIEKGWDKLGAIKTDDEYTKVKGKYLSYEVCKSLIDADGVLVISHVTGHVCTGFGGAIKNLGMGAVTKKTKAEIHSGGEPKIVGTCTFCKICEQNCPIGGITVTDKPEINTCYGCSNCIYVCPSKVFKPKNNYFDILLAESAMIAESQFKKKYFINYLVNISKECDCEQNPKQLISGDNGYLMGENAVSIDKATYDLIIKNEGENVFKKHNFINGIEQIDAAEKNGMGNKLYELVELNNVKPSAN